MAKEKDISKILDSIEKRLDYIEEFVSWSVLARQRFEVGDRVKFSEKAHRKMISHRRKNKTGSGKIVAVSDTFSISVLMDGYARPASFHHSFFDFE